MVKIVVLVVVVGEDEGENDDLEGEKKVKRPWAVPSIPECRTLRSRHHRGLCFFPWTHLSDTWK